jgi:hypothetical protein
MADAIGGLVDPAIDDTGVAIHPDTLVMDCNRVRWPIA